MKNCGEYLPIADKYLSQMANLSVNWRDSVGKKLLPRAEEQVEIVTEIYRTEETIFAASEEVIRNIPLVELQGVITEINKILGR